jgi:predicted DCC family thiol-disulfide oxidoreductase YuxK
MTHTTKNKDSEKQEYAIIYFDGVCNLCNSSINFIIDWDPDRYFRYAPLQSESGQAFLERIGKSQSDFDSILLSEGENWYYKSTAALRIARKLSGGWPLLYGFIIIPPFLRNVVYDIIARNRYRWFGRQDECRIPTPELKSLFLD